MKAAIRGAHRWVGLALALLWMTQALSGVLLVFGREMEEWTVPGPVRPLQPQAFGEGLAAIEAARPGQEVRYVMAQGGARDRFDVLLSAGDGLDYVRADGEGRTLQSRPYDYGFPGPGLFLTMLALHQTLFSGSTGLFLVGLSGVLLLVSIGLGLNLAWPARGRWRRTMSFPPGKTRLSGLHGFHRALGLWFAAPALIVAFAGTLIALGDPLKEATKSYVAAPAPRELSGLPSTVGPGQAIATALRRFPDAALSIVEMPDAEDRFYKIRLLQPGEPRRIFGTTVVFVDAGDGRVLKVHDALKSPVGITFFDALYPVHTGEFIGLAGRVISLLTGLWLATMIGFGVALWLTRRAMSRRAAVQKAA
ncbi:PepSY-associated TM helix domain-containing protein [Phenylobacterium sp.]|uniref:PepSY-associated TM helix domain-containing protein n=1 Tax=Phenylobacterium sp. TaxID=1871053 RepID=UPI002FC890F4